MIAQLEKMYERKNDGGELAYWHVYGFSFLKARGSYCAVS